MQQWQERCKQSSGEGKSALQVFYVKMHSSHLLELKDALRTNTATFIRLQENRTAHLQALK